MTLHETYKERLEDFDSNFIRGDRHKSDEWFISAKEHLKTTTLALIDSQISWLEGEQVDTVELSIQFEYLERHEIGERTYNKALQHIIDHLKEQKELISKEQ